jgi:3-methyladenine DNA glycosylase AlkD
MHKAAIKREQGQASLSHAEREQARLLAKAVGWMLREMGKRVSEDLLRDFLRQHAHEMPRTMLRYAIEKLSAPERQYWIKQKW